MTSTGSPAHGGSVGDGSSGCDGPSVDLGRSKDVDGVGVVGVVGEAGEVGEVGGTIQSGAVAEGPRRFRGPGPPWSGRAVSVGIGPGSGSRT